MVQCAIWWRDGASYSAAVATYGRVSVTRVGNTRGLTLTNLHGRRPIGNLRRHIYKPISKRVAAGGAERLYTYLYATVNYYWGDIRIRLLALEK